MIDDAKRCNELNGKEWLQHSFSIWRDLKKSKAERDLHHPASFPVALCEKVIRCFTKDGGRILDPFNGIGSTTLAAQALGREALGVDLSPKYCAAARERLGEDARIRIVKGDSREVLAALPPHSFELCLTSPPYWDILRQRRSADKRQSVSYSNGANDLGNIADYDDFLGALADLLGATLRLLTPGGYCVVNVMDIRKASAFYPLHSDLATAMQARGFIYDDLIIWDRQSDYNSMRPLGYPYRFRINKVHEYLLIFAKPRE